MDAVRRRRAGRARVVGVTGDLIDEYLARLGKRGEKDMGTTDGKARYA